MSNTEFPAEVEMSFSDHLEELRWRLLRSLAAVVSGAAICLLWVRPLVKLLEEPAQGIRFLQLAPGEFLFVSLKVAGYAGLTLALPYVLYEGLAFVMPGLTRRERRLVAPAVAASAALFLVGLAFQLPVLQLLLGLLGLVRWRPMLASWRLVILFSAVAGAVLTPSTDPVTMLLLSGAISALFLVGVGLVALTEGIHSSGPDPLEGS